MRFTASTRLDVSGMTISTANAEQVVGLASVPHLVGTKVGIQACGVTSQRLLKADREAIGM